MWHKYEQQWNCYAKYRKYKEVKGASKLKCKQGLKYVSPQVLMQYHLNSNIYTPHPNYTIFIILYSSGVETRYT